MKTKESHVKYGVIMSGISGLASLIVFVIACFKHSIELFLVAIYLAQWESGSTVVREVEKDSNDPRE